MTPIVTATDARYLPGVMALYNSYLRNSKEGFSFHVLAYGDESLKSELDAAGIDTLLNKHIPDVKAFPKSKKYSWYRNNIESAAMYARLLVPDLFPDSDYAIYVDADAIILKSLSGLLEDMGDFPVGATRCWSPMKADVPGVGLDNVFGMMTSFLVFNVQAWRDQQTLKQCIHLMNTSKHHFKTVVQGVLQLVIGNNYYQYPQYYQVQGGHPTNTQQMSEAYFLHFCGTNPWEAFEPGMPQQPFKLKAREIWRGYV